MNDSNDDHLDLEDHEQEDNASLKIIELNSGKMITGIVEDNPDDETEILIKYPMMVMYNPVHITDDDGDIIAEGMRTILLRYAQGSFHGVVNIKKSHIVMMSDTDYEFDSMYFDRIEEIYPEDEYDDELDNPDVIDYYDDPKIEKEVIQRTIRNPCKSVSELIEYLTGPLESTTKH